MRNKAFYRAIKKYLKNIFAHQKIYYFTYFQVKTDEQNEQLIEYTRAKIIKH